MESLRLEFSFGTSFSGLEDLVKIGAGERRDFGDPKRIGTAWRGSEEEAKGDARFGAAEKPRVEIDV